MVLASTEAAHCRVSESELHRMLRKMWSRAIII